MLGIAVGGGVARQGGGTPRCIGNVDAVWVDEEGVAPPVVGVVAAFGLVCDHGALRSIGTDDHIVRAPQPVKAPSQMHIQRARSVVVVAPLAGDVQWPL